MDSLNLDLRFPDYGKSNRTDGPGVMSMRLLEGFNWPFVAKVLRPCSFQIQKKPGLPNEYSKRIEVFQH